jgi:ribonucleoside-diphosphate reductase alpha chain
MTDQWEELSKERKKLQSEGHLPDWFTTQGWQAFKEKMLYQSIGYRGHCERIARTLAQWAPKTPAPFWVDPDMTWEKAFFNVLWSGKLVPSSPVACNTGTDRGFSVSCSGGYVGDSISSFYERLGEGAKLSQTGFGISSYLGDIRERGAPFSNGEGKASGILPVLDDFVTMAGKVSQGGARRGAWAGYIPMAHGDFYESAMFLKNNPDDCNIGWNVYDEDINKLNQADPDMTDRFQETMLVKAMTGKGYFMFPDKANHLAPPALKRYKTPIRASNLCTEIMLPQDEDYTFTCVLSSLNLAMFDELTPEDIFTSIVFLDCVAEDFIQKAKDVHELRRAVDFTRDFRALGLGALGFHTYLQRKSIVLGSVQSFLENTKIFNKIRTNADYATEWLAEVQGEPLRCEGLGARNATLLAIAPNTTSALVGGSVSQGIEPVFKNTYTQGTAAGEMLRINPALIELMQEKGIYNNDHIKEVRDADGSVQEVDWLTEHEKAVFRTFPEVPQEALIDLASARTQIDQWQSLNLAFSSDASEEYIASVFQKAFLDKNIKAVYYSRMSKAAKASSGECIACE